MNEESWCREAVSSTAGWKATHRLQLQTRPATDTSQSTALAVRKMKCEVCLRIFRRTGDLKRHKSSSKGQKPVCKQHGGTQCTICKKWFCSKGS